MLPGLACVFAFVWVLTCWYSWMGKFRSAVQVDLDHIRVVTPVRHFVASWNAIKAVHPRSHISLVSFDGAKFRIPQYSATLVTEAAAERAPLFLGRKRLELAITSAMNGAGAASHNDPEFEVRWVYPSTKIWISALLVGAVAEVVAYLLHS